VEKVSGAAAIDLLSVTQPAKMAKTIADRQSEELIIALVGPVGSGVSTTALFISEILSNDFDYRVCPIIKPSEIIKKEAYRVGISPISKSVLNKYIEEMQDAGNKLREKFGGDYLAQKIVEQIYKFRSDSGGYSDQGVQLPARRAYIIDSLKNTEELDLLKSIYGDILCVFGVFAPDAQREHRLVDGGAPEVSIKPIMDRDQSEVATFGQKTRKLFVDADFFVCNDHKKDELKAKIKRFIDLIFDTHIHTPTRSESAMYEASASAANSACMSRQVGAAIVSKESELIAVGWNDVPRFGGGLYNEDDQYTMDSEKKAVIDRDNRCFKWGGCICHNEIRRSGIIDKIAQKILDSDLIKKGKTISDIKASLSGTAIDSLIEFSRSIHAEMEAILAVAREGRHSLVGATLYTNTYPCHNCARHIVASGIKTVYYIEPYLKSLATELHKDAITENPDDRTKVVFRQYDGVAPRRYLRLFRPSADRKRDGHLSRTLPKLALPIFRVALDSPTEYEVKVIAELSAKEHPSSSRS
jgi:deoxycytidylate deaminase